MARGGLSADGRSLLLVGEVPGLCFAPALYAAAPDPRPLATVEGPAADGGPCARWAAAAAADGGALAVHEYNAGAVHLLRRRDDRLVPDATLRLPGAPGHPFPPPGRSVALSADGGALLVGAVERGCRRLPAGVRCGQAYVYRRGPEGDWRLAATLDRPAGAGEGAHFGQSVLLLPDGALLVGGTGLFTGDPGALHLFAPDGRDGYALAQTLLGDGDPPGFFATDLAASADGARLAVGEAQAVALYRREEGHGPGAPFARTARLEAPEDNAGHFGEAVALDGAGRTLLVGAPRAACAAGQRCGIAYRYVREGVGRGEAWRLAGRVRAAPEVAHAAFGRAVALAAAGDALAVDGRAVHLERKAAPSGPRH